MKPPYRRLRAYVFDPSLSQQLETATINQTTLHVPWEEDLKPGPVGEYLEVVDFDPPSGCFYAPVDLNDTHILAQDGLPPSEGNPQFHQQMVYAVAMKTIRNFERALGRTALWAPRWRRENGEIQEEYVGRLRIYPHGLREANAYYSPQKKALVFGYFPASFSDPGKNLPGGTVFSCLSHDVIAHETTHALLDGLHRRFAEPSNVDVLAFHEAFSDLVALFQHFTYPEALRHQIARTRGDLARQNMLGELAQQFGQAIGLYGGLRDALGRVNPGTKRWEPLEPDPARYQTTTESHARGAILVAAVFDAFLSIYKSRIADLLRIATAGTGVLPEGELHPDLVNRLAGEASKTAQHILNMCIRALDYCPPVDLTFGEYLRALITADRDLVADDNRGYRIAMIESFRRFGIYPRDVRTLSAESLCWQPPVCRLPGLEELLGSLSLQWDLGNGREEAYRQMRENARHLHAWLAGGLDDEAAFELGLALDDRAPATIPRGASGKPNVEVHSVRPARRIGPDRQLQTDVVIEITQKRNEPVDPSDPQGRTFKFRGGATLVVNLQSRTVRCSVGKSIRSEARLRREREFRGFPQAIPLRATYFGLIDDWEPFALLHRAL